MWAERKRNMYHYVEDKQLLQKMRSLSGEMLQTLCHYLKEDYKIGAIFYLVGSGGRNLVLQNENTPIDLDYNLEIKKCEDFDDCRNLKECVRKSFNKVLKEYDLRDCDDSKSCLTTKQIWFTEGNSTRFSIDLCIVVKSKNAYYRLIHEKTGWTNCDRYFWNEAPHSTKLKQKVDYIKKSGKWDLVRDQYLRIKNMYLSCNDHTHPSFICYIEAVNNVYNSRYNW